MDSMVSLRSRHNERNGTAWRSYSLVVEKFAFVLIISLLCLKIEAQQKKAILKFSPLHLADDFNFPTIQAGIEWNLSSRMSWYNEFGIKYRKSYMDGADTSFYKSRGFKIKSEVRYYFQKKRRRKPKGVMEGLYFGANIFGAQDFHNTAISYFKPGNDTTSFIDNFGVKKNIYALHLVFGIQQKIGRRFYMDCFGGLGMRYRNISTINKEFDYDTDQRINSIDLNIPDIRYGADSKAGNTLLPAISLGFRLCYRL
ncbi:MAG: DUF3575 domain-containing protein [Agriterribacter sp.]